MKTKPETIHVVASQRVEAENSRLASEQDASRQALDQAVRKADENARKTAQALGLRLLGVASLNKNLLEDESGQGAAARVEAEYFVSGFHQ